MFFIRQGATHKVVLGPAVAVGDGFTPVTTLALTTADEAEAILHDNGTVVDISGYTWAAITTADGYYHLTLQSGISNTVGHLTIVVNDDSLCLPIKAEFTVVEEAVYDAFYAASAPGLVGTAQTGDSFARLGAPAGASHAADNAAIKSDTSATLADTNELQTDWANGGRLDLLIDAILADTNELQTDLTDGGRLDLLIDAIKAKTDLIPGTTDGLTFSQKLTLFAAVLLGKASGLETTEATYRAADDSKNRVVATVDADGNRTVVTLDAS